MCSNRIESVWKINIFFYVQGFGTDETPLSESEFTLPLLSRNKRSLEKNSTKVTVKLKQEELDAIVDRFNRTLSGNNFKKLLIYHYSRDNNDLFNI